MAAGASSGFRCLLLVAVLQAGLGGLGKEGKTCSAFSETLWNVVACRACCRHAFAIVLACS